MKLLEYFLDLKLEPEEARALHQRYYTEYGESYHLARFTFNHKYFKDYLSEG